MLLLPPSSNPLLKLWQLPEAIAILRKMNPYAFEELLLTCCHERGWEIERNFSYSNDGELDGRVLIAGKLYLIQAKRYRGYINPKHIRDFYKVIRGEEAHGGFFIHSGRTGELSKELLREYQISLLSGQRLINFVLGQKSKFVG
ncbi:restriction endonuclease [Aliterella atlantica]|uniref:restriction endonuclease n=1 Tax=Aliterella atlantica TaxID=1827278 RepID=UPI000696D1C5|nr:restriction endonuclease [Aliterella atlantica]